MIVRNKTSRKIIAFCWGVGIETSRDKTINPGESAKFDDLPLPKRYVVCCQEIEGSKDDFKMPFYMSCFGRISHLFIILEIGV